MFGIHENLNAYLLALTKEQLIDVMEEALDRMQHHNARSITFCIASSLPGVKVTENDDGTYTYSVPSQVKVEITD